MTFEETRRVAMKLPETVEEPHFDKTSFRVGGKIFATAPPGGEVLHIFVDEDETRSLVAEEPGTFEELWWGKRIAGVRVNLEAADPDHVTELLEEAWRRKAPKRLHAELDADSK